MRALVSLDSIASRICSGMGDSTMSYKFSVLTHLISVYKEFHLFVDHDFEVKTAILKPDHVIEMPCDFVYETKVGLMRNGRCAILRLDRNMPQASLNQTGTQEYLETIWAGNEYVGGLYYPFYNSAIRDLCGYGCNLNIGGLYNINKKNGTIEIGSLIPSDAEIVIEYKSDGVSDGGLKLVPSETVDVLSYGAKERFYEERRDFTAAAWNGNKHKEKWYMTKRLLNFTSALYIAETAYNSTSEI